MTEAGLKVVSFRGNNLFNSDFEAYFVGEEGQAFDTNKATTIETDRVGQTPSYGRIAPDGIRLAVEIHVLNTAQTKIDLLKQYFSTNPLLDQGYLIATSEMGSGTQRRILCACEGLTEVDVNIFKAILRSSEGTWEEVTENSNTENIIATGQTWDISCSGSYPNFPKFIITPNANKGQANDYIYRRRAIIANASPLPLDHAIGDGYPLDIVDAALDTSTLQGAGKVLSSLNDVRVLLNSEEQYRWTSPDATPDAASKVWVNLQYRPTKKGTLATAISSSDTALQITESEGFAGWPTSWLALIDTEAIIFTDRTLDAMPTIVRGALNTTAASHSPGATVYLVDHRYLNLIYGYSGAGSPDSAADRKPVIDLDNSSNGGFSWVSYFNDSDRRSGTWIRTYTDDNVGSQYIRLYESAGQMFFDNNYAEAGKPRANNAIFDVPCGISIVSITNASNTGFWLAQSSAGSSSTGWKKTTTVEHIGYSVSIVGNKQTYTEDSHTTDTTIEYVANRGQDSVDTLLTTYQPDLTSSDTATVPNTITTVTYEAATADADTIVSTSEPYNFYKYVIDSEGYESILGGSTPLLDIFRIRLNVEIPIAVDANGDPFTSIPAYNKSSGLKEVVTVESITFRSQYMPKIVLAPEESLYLNQGRLTNTTNGTYLDIFFPQALGQALSIDCETRKVIDLETGFEVPFAVVLGQNVFPYNDPNVVNTWQWDEVGVNDTDIVWSKRDRWH